MAEQVPQRSALPLAALRWRGGPAVAIATIALAGATVPGGPPAPPALPPDRTRIVRSWLLGAVVGVQIRTWRRWIRLRLACPAIGRAPSSRIDTPALPTVGRPRDDP
jgi:hypothetical protein